MTVRASKYKTSASAYVTCDPVKYCSIKGEAYYRLDHQEKLITSSSSAKSGSYVNLYPPYGTFTRARGIGTITVNGEPHRLYTIWEY